MKVTIITEENRKQICLHPQSDYDSSVLKALENLPNTHRTHLYKRQGGYTAFDSYSNQYDDELKDDYSGEQLRHEIQENNINFGKNWLRDSQRSALKDLLEKWGIE